MDTATVVSAGANSDSLSMASSATKKHKQSDDFVLVSSGSSVTALVASHDHIYSGHRDGTISKWNIANVVAAVPVWKISACTDLTNHEEYGKLDSLGIAGLALKEDTLYSWNHQREDMRPTNGIPQKIMIWKCSTGERCAALMIDVGRSTSGSFANPLISCMLFCKLLVTASPSENQTGAESSTWVDTVLVGVQAMCDSPPISAPVAVTAAETPPAKPPSANHIGANNDTRGNLLPFNEKSRRRMPPWNVGEAFVRALVYVSKEELVVSFSEFAHGKNEPHATLDECEEPVKVIPPGGETHEIIVWDTKRPGTALHRLELYSIRTNKWTTKLRGRVCGVGHSRGNIVLSFSEETGGVLAVFKLPDRCSDKPQLRLKGFLSISGSPVASVVLDDAIAIATNSSVAEDCGIFMHPISSLMSSMEEKHTTVSLLQPVFSKLNEEKFTSSTLILHRSYLVAGFPNGSILCSKRVKENSESESSSACCSAVSPGLSGQLTPHLSPTANDLQLKNECTIQ